MEARSLLDLLAELATEAGFRVQALSASAAHEGEPPTRSGHCRLNGEVRVILVAQEPLEDRIEVLAEALRLHGGASLASRFIPPAARERIEGDR